MRQSLRAERRSPALRSATTEALQNSQQSDWVLGKNVLRISRIALFYDNIQDLPRFHLLIVFLSRERLSDLLCFGSTLRLDRSSKRRTFSEQRDAGGSSRHFRELVGRCSFYEPHLHERAGACVRAGYFEIGRLRARGPRLVLHQSAGSELKSAGVGYQ